MANEKEVRGVRRFRYRWSAVLVTISVLGSIATAYLLPRKTSIIERAIEAKLADLCARGVPLTPAEIAKILPDPDPDHDARNLLAKATELSQRKSDSPDLPLLGDGQLPKRGEPITEPVMDAIRGHLADRAAMEAIPECLDGVRFSLKWNGGSTNPPAHPKFFEIRDLIQTLMLQAIYEAERGNSSRVREALRKGFQITWAVNDDDLVMAMIRVGCADAMCTATEQVLNRIHLTAPELMELERQILPERIGNFGNAFVTERAVRLMWFDEDRKQHSRRNLKARFKEIAETLSRRAQPKYRDEDRLLFLDSMEARERTLSLPVASCLQSNFNIEADYWERVKSVAGEENGGFWRKALTTAFETRARLIALKTALAVQRHRLANSGALPSSLADLVPEYLPALPTDLFDDQPLRYGKRDAGCVIYSIGADSKDNGGKEPTEPPEPEGYDVTVIVER